MIRARLVQLHEQLYEQLHNFNSQTANSLLNSLVSFLEVKLKNMALSPAQEVARGASAGEAELCQTDPSCLQFFH
jgi:hypothetical protein